VSERPSRFAHGRFRSRLVSRTDLEFDTGWRTGVSFAGAKVVVGRRSQVQRVLTKEHAVQKKSFVRRMVRAGIPASRSKRLAERFWVLSRPEAFGKVIRRTKGKKIYAVKGPGGRHNTIYVVKGTGRLVIRGVDGAVSFTKKRTKSHK